MRSSFFYSNGGVWHGCCCYCDVPFFLGRDDGCEFLFNEGIGGLWPFNKNVSIREFFFASVCPLAWLLLLLWCCGFLLYGGMGGVWSGG